MPHRLMRAIVPVALAAAVAACDGGGAGAAAPASLRFAELSPVVEVSAERWLDVTVLDARGRPIASAPVRFRSSRPEVARVDSITGVVAGLAEGTAEITATAAPAEATVTVTVHPYGGIEVAWVRLGSPTYPVLEMRNWPDTATVPVTLQNAAGVSLCGRAPLTVQVDDSSLVVPTLSQDVADRCAVKLKMTGAGGSTWLRARAGAHVDSLRLRITPFQVLWDFRPPAKKIAGATVQWEVAIRYEDGRAVAGVPVRFSYQLPYAEHPSGAPFEYDRVTVLTDAAGVARHQRAVASSTRHAKVHFDGQAEAALVSGPGGAMVVDWALPGDTTHHTASDGKPIVPGPMVTTALLVMHCERPATSSQSACSYSAAVSPIGLGDETCPDGTRVGRSLAVVDYDAHGNPAGSLPSLGTKGYLMYYASDYSERFFPDSRTIVRTWYEGSFVANLVLGEGVESTQVTLFPSGPAPKTFDVVRDTALCT